EIPDQGRAAFGALAQTYGRKLSQRADRLTQATLDRFDPRDEGRAYCAEPRNQDAELPVRGCEPDIILGWQSETPWRSARSSFDVVRRGRLRGRLGLAAGRGLRGGRHAR